MANRAGRGGGEKIRKNIGGRVYVYIYRYVNFLSCVGELVVLDPPLNTATNTINQSYQGAVCQGKTSIGQRCQSKPSTLKPSSFASVKVNYKEIGVGQGCQTDRSTQKPSSLASVKVDYWKIAVRQGVKVPSPYTFAINSTQYHVRKNSCISTTTLALFGTALPISGQDTWS